MPRNFRLIPHHERYAVFRLFLYCLVIAAAFTSARTVADSLFLSRIGSDNLAALFVVSGLVTAVVASSWIFLTRRLPLSRALRGSGLLFATSTLVVWWIMPEYHHALWLMAGIYLLAEIRGAVNAINILTAMNEILGRHSSRYAWATIGLGVPLAGIITGGLIGAESELVDLRTWLLVAALLDLIGAIPAVPSARLRVPHYSQTTGAVSEFDQSRFLAGNKSFANWQEFRFWIAILISAKVIVLTIITFEWKVVANAWYGGDELALARYFGIFYAAAGGATMLLQIFVTGRLLTRYGAALPILVMPAAFVVLNLLFFAGSGLLFMFVIATFAKAMEVWRRSVHDTSLGLLYTRLKRPQRRGAIALNAAVIKPLSEVGASLSLLLGSALVYKSVAVAATLVWIVATVALLQLLRRPAMAGRFRLNVKQLVPGLLDNR